MCKECEPKQKEESKTEEAGCDCGCLGLKDKNPKQKEI
ncbi:hypothetical protein BMS3Abin17_00197 [archaeon BMS3Abin17]|nr:hypothetical protein BMS3Abin17_00197 [archaeon BMS3Abin17]